MALPEFVHQLGPLVLKGFVGIVLTGLLGILMYPFRKINKEWKALRGSIEDTHTELTQQRTNCLATLQKQGEEQIILLTRTVSALDGVRLDLAEQTGYLRASTPRRRTAKK